MDGDLFLLLVIYATVFCAGYMAGYWRGTVAMNKIGEIMKDFREKYEEAGK
jgi:hypothetical protein